MQIHTAATIRGALRLLALAAACAAPAIGQAPANKSTAVPPPANLKSAKASVKQSAAEQKTAAALEAAKDNALQLRNFLFKMPKGADLHNHLSGAVYAESYIRAAAEDGLCVDTTALKFAKPVDTGWCSCKKSCGRGQMPASNLAQNQDTYDSLIDSFSMRGFVPSPGITAHDHFFATFGKFDGVDPKHKGEWLDEVATRAARQNEQYLELMETPKAPHTSEVAKTLDWSKGFASMRQTLLQSNLAGDIKLAQDAFNAANDLRWKREKCDTSEPMPACKIELRYLYQIARGRPKTQVFAQTVLGFETAMVEPRIVGINYVMPEDGFTSVNDYEDHMKLLEYLHGQYPTVLISLHAGELAPGLVPFETMRNHIQLAVERAGAKRIGHGVDIMYEDDAPRLMTRMAQNHVMVEISLTSNDVILGIQGKNHPFPVYRKFGVPVALATDDEGVSRIDLTNEYVRATTTYNLKYADLKQMVRTSLEHSFLPGLSLWREPDVFTALVADCSKDTPGGENPSASCTDFLKASKKASQQWGLERRFQAFEAEN